MYIYHNDLTLINYSISNRKTSIIKKIIVTNRKSGVDWTISRRILSVQEKEFSWFIIQNYQNWLLNIP